MYQPKWIGINELAARWGQTPQQILEHILEGTLPVFFPFEGLALPDENLQSNRDASLEASLREIRRHAAGYARMVLQPPDAPDKQEAEQIAQTYWELMASTQARVQELHEEVISRPLRRADCVAREHLRLDRDVVWSIYQTGAAQHPSSAWAVSDKETSETKERRMYLEPLPGQTKYRRERLSIADLFIPVSALPNTSPAPAAKRPRRNPRRWWGAEAEEIAANVRDKNPNLSAVQVAAEVATRLRLKHAPVGDRSVSGKLQRNPDQDTIRRYLREVTYGDGQ